MPPQPPIPRGKAIPLLLLSIGYLSFIPFGAFYLGYNLERLNPYFMPFSVYELLPIIGFALVIGYSQAVSGKKPWGAPKIFWIASTLFNIGVSYFLISNTSQSELLGIPTQLVKSVQEAFSPAFDPKAALWALANFGVVLALAMPLVAILSAIEARRAFRKTEPNPTATPEPA